MKTTTFVLLVLAVVHSIHDAYANPAPILGRDGCYVCPAGSTTTATGPDGATACDPSFVTYDRAWAALKRAVARAENSNASETANRPTLETEKSLTREIEEAKTPDRAWVVAGEAWRSAVSLEIQRQALAQFRFLAKSATEIETLNFMLAALENPGAEMEHCREWGRGTPLDRRKAADRLALLLQNPNLADRLK